MVRYVMDGKALSVTMETSVGKGREVCRERHRQ